MRAVDWSGAGRQKKKGGNKKMKRNCGCVRRFVSTSSLFSPSLSIPFFFFFCFSRMRALTKTLETLVGGGERFLQLTDDEFRFFFVRRGCVIERQT